MAETERLIEEQQLRTERMRAMNKVLSDIFSAQDLPESDRKTQLANLLAENPEIAEQLDKIESIYERLTMLYGVRVEIPVQGDTTKSENQPESSTS